MENLFVAFRAVLLSLLVWFYF